MRVKPTDITVADLITIVRVFEETGEPLPPTVAANVGVIVDACRGVRA